MKTWFYIVAVEPSGCWYNVAIKATKLTVTAEFARRYPQARILSIE